MYKRQIKHLLIEADRVVPLRINPETWELEPADLDDPEHDDLLDDLAEMVFRSKGEVVVLPKDRMPTTTCLLYTSCCACDYSVTHAVCKGLYENHRH